MVLTHISPVQYWFIQIQSKVFIHKVSEWHDGMVIKFNKGVQLMNKRKCWLVNKNNESVLEIMIFETNAKFVNNTQ
jgi:hypothetical protein